MGKRDRGGERGEQLHRGLAPVWIVGTFVECGLILMETDDKQRKQARRVSRERSAFCWPRALGRYIRIHMYMHIYNVNIEQFRLDFTRETYKYKCYMCC